MGPARVPRQRPRPHPRDGAAAPDQGGRATCSCTCRRSTGGPTRRWSRFRRRRRTPAALQKRFGTYRTLGWAEATWPLNEDRIDEKAFMDDLYRAFDDRASIIVNEVDERQVGSRHRGHRVDRPRAAHVLAVPRPDAPDVRRGRAAAKYGDAIERVYRRCDQLVGEVLDRVGPETLVMVLSDHGFHSFRQAVNLNTFLVEEGFLAREGGTRARAEARRGVPRRPVLAGRGLDAQPRAYSLGLGQIYFNLRGREAQGIVNPGDDYNAAGGRAVGEAAGPDRPGDRRPRGERRLPQGRRVLGTVHRHRARTCRWDLPTGTGCRGRPRSAARRPGSSIRTCGSGAATTARSTTSPFRAC